MTIADGIRLTCAILDEACIDCEEDCPCAGLKKPDKDEDGGEVIGLEN